MSENQTHRFGFEGSTESAWQIIILCRVRMLVIINRVSFRSFASLVLLTIVNIY